MRDADPSSPLYVIIYSLDVPSVNLAVTSAASPEGTADTEAICPSAMSMRLCMFPARRSASRCPLPEANGVSGSGSLPDPVWSRETARAMAAQAGRDTYHSILFHAGFLITGRHYPPPPVMHHADVLGNLHRQCFRIPDRIAFFTQPPQCLQRLLRNVLCRVRQVRRPGEPSGQGDNPPAYQY